MDFNTILDLLAGIKMIDAEIRNLPVGGDAKDVDLPHDIEIAGKKLANGTVPHYAITGVVVKRVK